MKKLFLSLLLMTCICSTQAKAGIFLMTSAMSDSNEWSRGYKQFGGMMTMGAGFVAGLSIINKGNFSAGGGVIFIGIVLDVEGNVSREQLVSIFSEKYPFIDNQTVLENLANTVHQKYEQTHAAYVSLSIEETLNILVSAELNKEQIAQVVNELR